MDLLTQANQLRNHVLIWVLRQSFSDPSQSQNKETPLPRDRTSNFCVTIQNVPATLNHAQRLDANAHTTKDSLNPAHVLRKIELFDNHFDN